VNDEEILINAAKNNSNDSLVKVLLENGADFMKYKEQVLYAARNNFNTQSIYQYLISLLK
jgi:hypothetical protein